MGKTVLKKDFSNVYSTSEVKIGTWIDGKPIYRKVITGTSTAGTTVVNLTNLQIDYPIYCKFIINNINNNSWTFENYYMNTADSQATYMESDKQRFIFRSGTSFAYGSYSLIVEYTKTTD